MFGKGKKRLQQFFSEKIIKRERENDGFHHSQKYFFFLSFFMRIGFSFFLLLFLSRVEFFEEFQRSKQKCSNEV